MTNDQSTYQLAQSINCCINSTFAFLTFSQKHKNLFFYFISLMNHYLCLYLDCLQKWVDSLFDYSIPQCATISFYHNFYQKCVSNMSSASLALFHLDSIFTSFAFNIVICCFAIHLEAFQDPWAIFLFILITFYHSLFFGFVLSIQNHLYFFLHSYLH